MYLSHGGSTEMLQRHAGRCKAAGIRLSLTLLLEGGKAAIANCVQVKIGMPKVKSGAHCKSRLQIAMNSEECACEE